MIKTKGKIKKGKRKSGGSWPCTRRTQSGLTRRRREELINNDRVSYLATYEG